MRKAAAPLALVLLAGCGSEPGETPLPAADAADRIECALAGAADFSRACWVERVKEGEKLVLVVRSDQGSFRRFDVLTDGRGVASADGADLAQVRLADGGIEVTVANDRYRLPATVAAATDAAATDGAPRASAGNEQQ